MSYESTDAYLVCAFVVLKYFICEHSVRSTAVEYTHKHRHRNKFPCYHMTSNVRETMKMC